MNDNKIPHEERSIVLNGFMGVGKTTVGQLLADKLNRPFIDIDEQIEKDYQMPIKNLFQKFGEKAFRQIEKETAIYHATQRQKIISLGGGAFMQEEIKEACLENCLVVHLDLSWSIWKERMSMLIDTRPVLQNKTMEEIESLFYERRKSYSESHSTLMTDGSNEQEVMEKIIKLL